MRAGLNPRWLAASLIWLAALFVSYLNYTQIQEVASIRDKNDRLRKEALFQHRNTARLDRIESMYAAGYLPVASATLGFELVRSRLQGMSANLGFQKVKIEGQMEQATESRVPVRLRMQGPLERIGSLFAALQSIPCLSVKSCRVAAAPPGPDAEIELALDFQFKIDPSPGLDIRSLQAATAPSEHKAIIR